MIVFTISCLACFAGALEGYAQTSSDSTVKRKNTGFNNSVKLHFGVFYIKDRHTPQKRMEVIGISFERKIHRKFGLGASYSQWESWLGGGPSGYKLEVWEPLTVLDTARGTLECRIGYRIVDVSIFYTQNLYKERHVIKAGLGVSYCWGENRYIVKQYHTGIPYWGDYGESRIEDVGYGGIVPQISYDYNFLNKRVNVGCDIRARYYSGIEVAQYDLGFHVGVKF